MWRNYPYYHCPRFCGFKFWHLKLVPNLHKSVCIKSFASCHEGVWEVILNLYNYVLKKKESKPSCEEIICIEFAQKTLWFWIILTPNFGEWRAWQSLHMKVFAGFLWRNFGGFIVIISTFLLRNTKKWKSKWSEPWWRNDRCPRFGGFKITFDTRFWCPHENVCMNIFCRLPVKECHDQ